jgi:hypothetical protein
LVFEEFVDTCLVIVIFLRVGVFYHLDQVSVGVHHTVVLLNLEALKHLSQLVTSYALALELGDHISDLRIPHVKAPHIAIILLVVIILIISISVVIILLFVQVWIVL